MNDVIRPARTETFEHTITGLLAKRADLFNEAERIRDRLAEIKNDVAAIDRVLASLGYAGDLDAAMPRQKRHVIFGRGELTRAILDVLRDAPAPMTTREIAKETLALDGTDARDRRLLSEHVKRVSKALRSLKTTGAALGAEASSGQKKWSRRTANTLSTN